MRVSRSRLEKTLLDIVRNDLLSPDTLDYLRAHVREVFREQREALNTEGVRTQLDKVEREIRNLIEAVATWGISPALRARLTAAEAERERLEGELKPAAILMPDLIPGLKARFDALLDNPAPDSSLESLKRPV